MEYLTRILQKVCARTDFKFHPLCKPLKLNHLLFADDLLLFCKGDKKSIMVMLRAFATFGQATGLSLNSGKSEIYYNGVAETIKQELSQLSGIRQGKLPFRYLGVPITHKRINADECSILLEKMADRIKNWGTRHLSYAGRMVLVKAVLLTVKNYWAQIFIIPIGVIQKIDAMCRNFLWAGQENYVKAPMINWQKACRKKKQGGLGIIDGCNWNIAAVGKLVWWLATKADHLWVKWIDNVYLKGAEWLSYQPKTSSSWYWRKICETKEKLKPGYCNGKWNDESGMYTIAKGYELLQGNQPNVEWLWEIWNRFCVPKHSFIGWLVCHDRLQVLTRIKKWCSQLDTKCFLCQQADETRDHLFFRCEFSSKCLMVFSEWINVNCPTAQIWRWCRRYRSRTLVQKCVLVAGLNALIYIIWMQRNECRLFGYVKQPTTVIQEVIRQVKGRFARVFEGKLKTEDLIWCQQKMLV